MAKGKVMKTPILALLLMAWLSPPLYAGQLLIKETETAIVVEYTGDPAETGKTNTLEDQAAFRNNSKSDEEKRNPLKLQKSWQRNPDRASGQERR